MIARVPARGEVSRATTNLIPTFHRRISTMRNPLKKRPPKTDGAEFTSSSMRLDYHRICKLMTFHSKERTVHRRDESAARYRKRVGRCFPASQIMLGRHQRAHKTLRCEFQSDRTAIPLSHSSQESKDVKDKLGDLVLWLTKLKDGVLTTSADENREEAERRAQLTRFALHPSHLLNQTDHLPQIFRKH